MIFASMRDFRKLIAWQKASALEDRVEPYLQLIIRKRPILGDQIDRSTGSIPANIAEGCGRETKADFRKFLTQAISSSTELENHLIKARKLKLISPADMESLTDDVIEVRKVIHGLRNTLN